MGILYVRAEHARARAEERFNEVRQLSHFMIFDLYDELARVPGTTLGRMALVDKAEAYLDRLATEDGAPLELKIEALSGKTRLATVLGVQGSPNLGRVADATRTLDAAILALQVLHVQAPLRVDVRAELAFALVQRATIEIWNEHRPQLARPMLARARDLLGTDASQRSLEVRQELYLRSADLADWAQDVPGLAEAAKTALAELSRWPEAMRQSESFATQHGRMLVKLGDSLYYGGDLRAALAQYREAAAALRDADARWPDRGAILDARQLAAWSIATTLSNLNGNREALPEFEVALGVIDRLQQLEKNDVTLLYHAFTVRSGYAEALSMLGRHAEAEQRFRALIAERQARMDAAPDDPSAARGVAYEWFILALAQERSARRIDACRSFAESARRFSELDGRGTLTAWDRTEHLRVALQRSAGCR
jgi:tetratricopeptide (TPR) repeat protein